MSRRIIVASLLLAACLGAPARAGIYSHTADDGSISLTNVPSDPRFNLLLGESSPPASTTGSSKPAPVQGRPYQQVVQEVSQAYGLDSALLNAVISVESGYNPKAVSRKGATGLMQLMPETARRYGVANALDPRENLHGGARYLKDLLKLFDNDLSLALAAYNAGEAAVIKHGRRIPPYGETLRYVPKVLDLYHRAQPNS
jgi:soluble lytic murein transglycosylase-like protein